MKVLIRQRAAFVLTFTIGVCATGLLLRAEPQQPVGTWAPLGAVAHAPSGAAAVPLGDGRTLIAGGTMADGVVTDIIVTYDPIANASTSVGRLISPRSGHSATLLKDGRVLFAGGMVGGAASADIELFDPAAQTSVLAAFMFQPRTGHAAAHLADGRVLIVGGTTSGGAVLQTGEIYDPATGNLAPAPHNLQQPRSGASATTLIDGRVLVAGGTNGQADLATAEIFDRYSHTFTVVDTQMSVPRSGHTAILLSHNNSVLIAGGLMGMTSSTAAADLFLPAEFPDPFSLGIGRFAATGAMTAPRGRAIGGPAGNNGYAFVAGGGRADAEAYRFATIKTDKDDYAPGRTAIITGSGWEPLEQVRLVFQEDPAVHDDYRLTVTADTAGNIYWDQWAPEQHDLGVRFYLTALGSKSRAQTTFTDDNVQNNVVVGGNDTIDAGDSTAITYRLVGNNAPNGDASGCNATATAPVTLAISVNSNVTASSSTVSFTGCGNPGAQTVTFSSSTAGSYPVTHTISGGLSGSKYNNDADWTLKVNSTNQPPTAANDSYDTDEGSALSIPAAGVLGNDSDPNSDSLTALIVTNAAHGTVALAADGSFTYTPEADFFGADSFTYKANDSTADSNVATVSVTVNAVNDAPSFAKGGDTTVSEDSGAYSQAGWATAITAGPGESSQTVSFLVTNGNNTLFSVQPAVNSAGTLSFTPAPNAFGTAMVTVHAKDDGGTDNGGDDTSEPQTFTITVNAVNDPPSFASGGDVTVNEDSGPYSQSWATAVSAGPNESGQIVSFVVTNGNPVLFSVQPAVATNGVLTFTPAPNAFGPATITIHALDNGGSADGGNDTSNSQTFSITVNPNNDPPTFSKGADVTVNEDSGPFSQAAWASAISAGPNESSQTVSFVVTNSNPTLFSVQPAVGGDGTLTFSPIANAFGAATVSIVAKDDGGIENGGDDTSEAQTFTITVIAINDPPSFTKGGDVMVNEDSGSYAQSWATAIGAGPSETGQVVSFVATNSSPALFSAQPAVGADGMLTFTPAPNAFGVVTVTVYAQDNGGTDNGGDNTSDTQMFTITVMPVNDAPSVTGLTLSKAEIDENETVVLSGAFSDPDTTDSHVVTINWGDGTSSVAIGLGAGAVSFVVPHQYLDDNPTTSPFDINDVLVAITDDGSTTPGNDPLSASGSASIRVNNLAVVATASEPGDPVQLGSPASVKVNFTDAGSQDNHTCTFNWDDGTVSGAPDFLGVVVSESGGNGSCTGTKTYASAGVYTVTVTVADDDTGSATVYYRYVVVFDPSAGFVTGGGWINSPAGAYVVDPSAVGKASFGFVSKYAKGAKVPSGETQFQFKAGNLNFHSMNYEWLVVAGAKAQYKGTGTVNGGLAPNGTPYKFLLTATDGQANGGREDMFRIKIWWEAGTASQIVYDNSPSSEDIDKSTLQALGGGSIVIHSK